MARASCSHASFVIPYGEIGRGDDVLGGRVALRVAVDRRGRGEDDADAGGRRGLEEPLGREHVAAKVEAEALAPARAHAGLRGEVEDAVPARDDGSSGASARSSPSTSSAARVPSFRERS